MATKKKVPEKKVVKNRQFIAVNWVDNDLVILDSMEEYVQDLVNCGVSVVDIIEDHTFLTIKDGEICEIVDLTIDIPKVVPTIKFKTV